MEMYWYSPEEFKGAQMVSYRRIEQQDILSSLTRAEEFMRECRLGPLSERILDRWLELEPYSKIAGAADDAALAKAMEDGRAGIFTWFGNVIEHHARHGRARDIY